MTGKKITEKQAAAALASCDAPKADILFLDERPAKLMQAAAADSKPKEISAITGGAKCWAMCC